MPDPRREDALKELFRCMSCNRRFEASCGPVECICGSLYVEWLSFREWEKYRRKDRYEEFEIIRNATEIREAFERGELPGTAIMT